ncbi:hypothetical protein Y032_0446g1593 [Ancylostoma ceylanicum]|uniref:Uncharacterized protein n=1 Tax=Ancylostoma ceylanicum TaxID=53326 RepID=A0A016WYG3_9BILA|nr:hypothetical protein Y032_0446g1593 [Ancylostoma ceylanicum]
MPFLVEKLQSVLGGGKDSAQNQPAPIIFAPVLVLATGQGSVSDIDFISAHPHSMNLCFFQQNFKLGGMDRLPQLPLYPPINPQARPEGSVPDRLPAEWIPVPMRNDRETLVEHTEIPLHPGM